MVESYFVLLLGSWEVGVGIVLISPGEKPATDTYEIFPSVFLNFGYNSVAVSSH